MSNETIKVSLNSAQDLLTRVNIIGSMKDPSTQVAMFFPTDGLYIVAEGSEVGAVLLELKTGKINKRTPIKVVDIEDLKRAASICTSGTLDVEVCIDDEVEFMLFTVRESSDRGGTTTTAKVGIIKTESVVIDTEKLLEYVSSEPTEKAKTIQVKAADVKKIGALPLGKNAYKMVDQDRGIRYTTTFMHISDSRLELCRYGIANAVHTLVDCNQIGESKKINICIKNETLDTIINQFSNIVSPDVYIDFIVDEDSILYLQTGNDRLKVPINNRIGLEDKDVKEFDKIRDNVDNTKGNYNQTGIFKMDSKELSAALKICAGASDEGRVTIRFVKNKDSIQDSNVEIQSVGSAISISRTISAEAVTDKVEDLTLEDQVSANILAGIDCVNTIKKEGATLHIEGLKMKGDGGYNLISFKTANSENYGVVAWS